MSRDENYLVQYRHNQGRRYLTLMGQIYRNLRELENAQAMAAHESPPTTKLYDRTGDEITLDEVERITI